MSTISVIVQIYNVEKYLRRSVDSILAQLFSDYELILVDDGSSDRSGAICDKYAEQDRRVHVIHQENKGQAVARNFALDWIDSNSNSEWILFIDSDDYIHPNMFQFLMESSDLVDSDIIAFQAVKGSDNNFTWSAPEAIFEEKTGKQFMEFWLPGNDDRGWILVNKIYRRECLESIRFPVGRIHEDNATVYKILYNTKKISCCDAVLYYYYSNADSTMNTAYMNEKYDLRRLDWLPVLEEMICFFNVHQEFELKNWAEKFYMRSLINSYSNVKKYYPSSPKVHELRSKITDLYKELEKTFIGTIREDSELENIVHPRLSYCFWVSYGVLCKIRKLLKRK